jgi:hypothetical protein
MTYLFASAASFISSASFSSSFIAGVVCCLYDLLFV